MGRSLLCVRFFPTLRFANAGLRRINARYYTMALKALSFLSLFFIMNGSPLFAGPVEFAGGDGGFVEYPVVIRSGKHLRLGIFDGHQYFSSEFGPSVLKQQLALQLES